MLIHKKQFILQLRLLNSPGTRLQTSQNDLVNQFQYSSSVQIVLYSFFWVKIFAKEFVISLNDLILLMFSRYFCYKLYNELICLSISFVKCCLHLHQSCTESFLTKKKTNYLFISKCKFPPTSWILVEHFHLKLTSNIKIYSQLTQFCEHFQLSMQ